MRRTLIALAVLSIAVLAVEPANAGGYWVGYSSGHHYGPPRHYRPYLRPYPRPYPRYGYGYGYGYGYRNHHHDAGRYAAAGVLLGLTLGSVMNRPTEVIETRTYQPAPSSAPAAGPAYGNPAQAASQTELPTLGYRLARDGTCWLLEDAGNGRTAARPQAPEDCQR